MKLRDVEKPSAPLSIASHDLGHRLMSSSVAGASSRLRSPMT